jgi:hypothetical protein
MYYGYLVYFGTSGNLVVIFPGFDILFQEQSGNPGSKGIPTSWILANTYVQ